MAANESRIEAAKRRVRVARYSIGALAATALAVFGFAVRDAHPATHSSKATSPAATDSAVATGDSFSFDGGGSISPSSSFDNPTVQSAAS